PSDVTSEASHTALYDFLVSPMDDKKRVIIGEKQPSAFPTQPLRGAVVNAHAVNASQAEAIERAVNCDVYHLIWGPPGTGKTRVIPEMVQRVRGTFLLGAFTNTAVDKMLLSLLDSDPQTKFIRFGRSSESPELDARLKSIGRDPADCFTDDLAKKLG